MPASTETDILTCFTIDFYKVLCDENGKISNKNGKAKQYIYIKILIPTFTFFSRDCHLHHLELFGAGPVKRTPCTFQTNENTQVSDRLPVGSPSDNHRPGSPSSSQHPQLRHAHQVA